MRKFVAEFEITGAPNDFRTVEIASTRERALIEAKETVWFYFSLWIEPTVFWELPSREEVQLWIDGALEDVDFQCVPTDRPADYVVPGPGETVTAVWKLRGDKTSTMTFHAWGVEAYDGNTSSGEEYVP